MPDERKPTLPTIAPITTASIVPRGLHRDLPAPLIVAIGALVPTVVVLIGALVLCRGVPDDDDEPKRAHAHGWVEPLSAATLTAEASTATSTSASASTSASTSASSTVATEPR